LDPIRRLKGTQDILPDESPKWAALETIIRQQMELFNYKEIRTPVFELTELFARGIGELTDIVSKEMYTFQDRSKKNITLKPEMTAPVMRAYIENNLQAKSPINKLFYLAPLFRQENPQAGRLRQFHQFGAEFIGASSAEADAELAAMLVVSLPPTRVLRRVPPNGVRSTWLVQSPPGLSLCGSKLWCQWRDDEEYRVPVEPDWLRMPNMTAYFRVHRDSMARENDWEFERSFYIFRRL